MIKKSKVFFGSKFNLTFKILIYLFHINIHKAVDTETENSSDDNLATTSKRKSVATNSSKTTKKTKNDKKSKSIFLQNKN